MKDLIVESEFARTEEKTEPIPREKVIEVKNLTKTYDDKIVLDNISLNLYRGEALGILGANGAGKTTMLETIEGLRKIDTGKISILGRDLQTNVKAIQQQIGIQLQKTSLFEKLTVKENLQLFIRLYEKKYKPERLLEEVDLLRQKSKKINDLSGGQFQRLKLCLALINSPQIIFLDEPTTGLDPSARRDLWLKIRKLIDGGTSVILTTHYMEEAESLCNRIAILHKGKFIADDTPANLVSHLGFPKTIILDIDSAHLNNDIFKCYRHIVINNKLHIQAKDVSKELGSLLLEMNNENIMVHSVNIHEANLEDVFMKLTNSNIINGKLVQ